MFWETEAGESFLRTMAPGVGYVLSAWRGFKCRVSRRRQLGALYTVQSVAKVSHMAGPYSLRDNGLETQLRVIRQKRRVTRSWVSGLVSLKLYGPGALRYFCMCGTFATDCTLYSQSVLVAQRYFLYLLPSVVT